MDVTGESAEVVHGPFALFLGFQGRCAVSTCFVSTLFSGPWGISIGRVAKQPLPRPSNILMM